MKYTAEEIRQHRAEWVAALRSGKYQQTKSKLRTPEGYCCLGVATELAGVVGQFREDSGCYIYGLEEAGLPREARVWLGVTDALPVASNRATYSAMNDGGDSFEQIADHFEEYGFHSSIDLLAQEGAES